MGIDDRDEMDEFRKYVGFHSIFHSNINDERKAGILNDGDKPLCQTKNGIPRVAPNNGQINEHCRGPSVPVICVPNAIAMVVQQAINIDKIGL